MEQPKLPTRRTEMRSRYIVRRRPQSHTSARQQQLFAELATTMPTHNRLISTLAAEDAYTLGLCNQPRRILYMSTKRDDLKPTR